MTAFVERVDFEDRYPVVKLEDGSWAILYPDGLTSGPYVCRGSVKAASRRQYRYDHYL